MNIVSNHLKNKKDLDNALYVILIENFKIAAMENSSRYLTNKSTNEQKESRPLVKEGITHCVPGNS